VTGVQGRGKEEKWDHRTSTFGTLARGETNKVHERESGYGRARGGVTKTVLSTVLNEGKKISGKKRKSSKLFSRRGRLLV